jgi:hypothetical protein
MSAIAQVFEHRFPSGLDLPIAVLSIRLDDIATRLGMEPVSWEEPGLGPTRGVCIRLPSGRIVLILEHAYAIKYGAPGAQLVADGDDVVSLGVSALVDEILLALGLSDNAVAWKGGEDTRQSAARILGRSHGQS